MYFDRNHLIDSDIENIQKLSKFSKKKTLSYYRKIIKLNNIENQKLTP